MVDPLSSGGPITIPIAGDDPDAKAAVAALIEGMEGLEVVDLGPLRYAQTLEQMLVVWANARRRGAPFNYHLRPEPAQ
jgi:predicted dinucleotide-binding enzyme